MAANTNLLTEVAVANTTTLVANTFSQGNTAPNGLSAICRVAGIAVPGVYGSESIYPAAVIQLWAGATSSNIGAPSPNAALICQATVPPQAIANQSGAFVVEMVATLRANGAGVGANANQVWTSAVVSPDVAISIAPGANGVVTTPNIGNVAWNLSVVAVAAGGGQGANLLIETCTVSSSNLAS